MEKMIEIVMSGGNILIVSHINPDGDAVGSVTAMSGFLSSHGVSSTIILPCEYPSYLSFLDEEGKIIIYGKERKRADALIAEADLIVVLDLNRLDRLERMAKAVKASPARKVLIDHHPQPETDIFEHLVSNVELSSTCEILFWLFRSTGERFPVNIAQSLYVGMITDTNNFSNSVLSSTFRMAAELLDMGVDKEKLQHLVFGDFSEDRMRLMGNMLRDKMVVLPEYRAAYMVLSLEDQRKYNFKDGDSEGFVNMPLNIKDIDVSALFTEKRDHIRVSMRSRSEFSVNEFTKRYFDGGGHEKAAGGTLVISLDKVSGYFEDKIKTYCEDIYHE